MKNCNTILTEKQRYRQVELTNINFLQAKKFCHQKRKIEQAKFTYSPLRKAFEKQTKTIKEQIDDIKNQNKRLQALTNKDGDHKDKKIYNELNKKGFDKKQN